MVNLIRTKEELEKVLSGLAREKAWLRHWYKRYSETKDTTALAKVIYMLFLAGYYLDYNLVKEMMGSEV